MPRPPSVLWTTPWRRAPLLLRRSPAVLLAVLAAGLILGAAAAPLFLERQIRKLDAAPGVDGVWLPSEAAAQLGARPGDRTTVSLTGRSANVRVAGTYRELHRSPPTPYWCSLAERIYPPGFAEDPPPPLVLADRATFTAISRRVQETRLEFAWHLELADGVTLAHAKDTVAAYEAARRAVATDGRGMIAPEQAPAFNSPGVLVTASELPFLVQQSEAIVAAVGGAIGPVAIAGTGVVLLLVAFPMLFLVGTVALAVRLLGLAVGRLRTAGAVWPHALYLAARRVAHATHDPDALQFADRVLHLADGRLTERSP
jgi:hypothetical protein